jgi:hypothetical protein
MTAAAAHDDALKRPAAARTGLSAPTTPVDPKVQLVLTLQPGAIAKCRNAGSPVGEALAQDDANGAV